MPVWVHWQSAPVATPLGRALPERFDPVAVVIDVPGRTLTLWQNGQAVRHYPVAVGHPDSPTPLGSFRVRRKVRHPGWEHPYQPHPLARTVPAGAGNPLGTRWLGFHQDRGGEYGIHGTNAPQSIGRFSSHGCVRLRAQDAEVLFEQVPLHTPVYVRYEPIRVIWQGNDPYLVVYSDIYHRQEVTPEQIRQVVIQAAPQVSLNPGQTRQLYQRAASSQPVSLVPYRVGASRPAFTP
jgi:hypothetical protein